MVNLKSLGLFWTNLAESFCIPQKDVSVFSQRLNSEGLTFATITLPSLGKALDRALITGEPIIWPPQFKIKDNYPLFLNIYWRQLLTEDGILRLDVLPLNIKIVRQLTLMYYKLETSYGTDIQHRANSSFSECDNSLPDRFDQYDQILIRAKRLLGRLLSNLDPKQSRPRHGNGATGCRTKNEDKYHSFRYIPRLDDYFPYSEFFYYNPSHLCDELTKLHTAETIEEPCSRLALVPKDSRGPRIICCEPREFQYIQQGLMRQLYDRVESHPLTRGYVNFTDQTINQDLARTASITTKLATLDLKEASDRVTLALVQRIFPPNYCKALEACRTKYVQLLDGTVFGPLRKFASMGSALCFPVESLTFWSILKAGLHCDVYVYGDDIIVPTHLAEQACELLERYALLVNRDKSAYKTSFRESCGGDYYDGFNVGYVKVRKQCDGTIGSKLSHFGFVNELTKHFGECVSLHCCSVLESLYGPIPYTTRELPLCIQLPDYFGNNSRFKRRYNRNLQRVEYKIPQLSFRNSSKRSSPQYHWCELMRKELLNDREGKVGEYTLGLPAIRWKWVWLAD